LGPLTVAVAAAAAGAAFAPPDSALGIGLTLLLTFAAARLDLPRAMAILWGLAVVPIYIQVPGFGMPAELVVAPVVLARIFAVERRPISMPSGLAWTLAAIFVSGALASTVLSGDARQTGYYLLRELIWILYIPAARVVYQDAGAIAPTLAVVLLGALLQSVLGLMQLALNNDFTLGLLRLPIAPAFIPGGSLDAKLAAQDYNWINFDRAFPSGLFLNAIVYGVCLLTWGFLLVGIPQRWLPGRRTGIWRAAGVLSLGVAFLTFKLTAWLGIIAGVLTIMLGRVTDRRARLQLLLGPPLALALVSIVFRDAISERLDQIMSGSLFTRVLAWTAYLANLSYGGLAGVGLSRANVLAPSVPTRAAGQVLNLELAPESSPIGLAVEVGVPAMLALHALLIVLALRRRPFGATWVLPAMVAVLVGNLTVFGLTDDHLGPLVTLMAGLAAAAPSQRAS
jgi:hypothetical protein